MFEFKRALPYETGIGSGRIIKALKALNDKAIPMHSLIIMKDDRVIFEKYYAPYKADTLHRMFSISKTFSAVAIALLAEEGKVNLDASITDYFPEYVNESTHPWIRMTTIRNMLMMRTCHAASTYKVNMKSDWVESFFTVAPTHKPGCVFNYDTSGAHVLCALCEKLSGTDMLSYMKKKILHYVDFSDNSYMIKDPFGVSMGGSGLMATPMDVFKVLYILANGGKIVCNDGAERQLIDAEFVRAATSNLSDNNLTGPVPSEMQGYGMQIWQNEKGGFVLYGMGGQLAISLPSDNLLIMTTADTQGIQGGNQVIYDAIYNNLLGSKELPADEEADYKALCEYADKLSINPPRLPENFTYTDAYKGGVNIPDFIKNIASQNLSAIDQTYTLSYNLADNKSGFDKLILELSENDTCHVKFGQKETLHTIDFKVNAMAEGTFPIYDDHYAAGAIWTRDNVLYIKVHLIGECVGSVHLQFFFEESEVTVHMKKIEETYFQLFDGHLYGTALS